jgi:hypothetical protein
MQFGVNVVPNVRTDYNYYKEGFLPAIEGAEN